MLESLAHRSAPDIHFNSHTHESHLSVSSSDVKGRRARTELAKIMRTGWVIAEKGNKYPTPRRTMRNLHSPRGSPLRSPVSVAITAAYGDVTKDDFRCMVRESEDPPRRRRSGSLSELIFTRSFHATAHAHNTPSTRLATPHARANDPKLRHQRQSKHKCEASLCSQRPDWWAVF